MKFRHPPLFMFAIVVTALCARPEARAEDDALTLLQQTYADAVARDYPKAIWDCDRAIELDPTVADAYYVRGRCRFASGLVEESLVDFDRYLQLRSTHASRLWERGISLYYAGRYAEGARQFALYQTYFTNDVENAVWRYLCMARSEGVAKAREQLLPIEHDRRVPMMEIYALFRGEATIDDVLRAAGSTDTAGARLNRQRFYAHLYLGLNYEADGNEVLVGAGRRRADRRGEGHRGAPVATVREARNDCVAPVGRPDVPPDRRADRSEPRNCCCGVVDIKQSPRARRGGTACYNRDTAKG